MAVIMMVAVAESAPGVLVVQMEHGQVVWGICDWEGSSHWSDRACRLAVNQCSAAGCGVMSWWQWGFI